MIYLDNITSGQTVYIPRNESGVNPHKIGSYWDGFEDGYESGETHQKNFLSSVTFTENGEYERENGWSAVTVDVPQTGSTAILEEKTVVISADTTNVTPSSGCDGMSDVTVDASSYAQQNYDNGFDEGFTDGYSSGNTDGYESGYTSGHTDGVNEEKEKLSAATFTANTTVTISDGGYSAITINVPQTGHTDQELEEEYESGHTEGMEDQKTLLSSTAFTENGSYSMENGWSGVTVNVDTASTYNSGYTSGYTDGQDNIIGTFSSMTATTNGQYGSTEHPMTAITVNVPQQSSQDFIEYIEGTTMNLTIPSGTTTIRNNAFYDQYYFTGLTFTDTLTSIGNYAFYDCRGFSNQDLTIPSGVTNIGMYAFWNCTGLTGNLTVSSTGETTIGNGAFLRCNSITGITFSGLTNLGNNTFSGCTNLTTISGSNNIKSIGGECFINTNLSGRIELAELTYLGSGAFSALTGISTVVLGDKLSIIRDHSFMECRLSTIYIGSGVTAIQTMAFYDCTSLREIYCYAQTAPTVSDEYTLCYVASSGTLHHPVGTDYSSFMDYLPSGWRDVADL